MVEALADFTSEKDNLKTRVVSTTEIMHRAGEQGPRIGKVQEVEVESNGVKTTTRVEFWYQWETGKLLYIR